MVTLRNERPYRTKVSHACIGENHVERWIKPPYSPDISIYGYNCFRVFKKAIGVVHM